MGRTRTAPQDYERPAMIVSQIVKLCAHCGHDMAWKLKHFCPKCGSSEYHEVFEHMKDIYRNGLEQIEKEIERAAQEVERIYSQYHVTEAIVEAFVAITERPEFDATPEQEQQAAENTTIDLWLIGDELLSAPEDWNEPD